MTIYQILIGYYLISYAVCLGMRERDESFLQWLLRLIGCWAIFPISLGIAIKKTIEKP